MLRGLAFLLSLAPLAAHASVSVTLANARGSQEPLTLDNRHGPDLVIDLDQVLRYSHATQGVRPRASEGFYRRVSRAKGNFAALVEGIVACANVYAENGYASCDEDAGIELYNMLGASYVNDPGDPTGLRMADLFGAPIKQREAASFYLDLDNPLLAGLGFATVSCHPVINDDANATCLLEPR